MFGSENYSVWLKLDSDLHIKDGGCDCPYGGACKHMAAL
ncbi:SWIM zinc finger family protein [Neisseria elongata]|nr:SWIM zinc finger family protein [Neisseria elongata]